MKPRNKKVAMDNMKTVFGTKEWAKENINILSGCSHDCRYCYAKATSVVRHRSKTVDTWKEETLNRRKLPKHFRKRDGRIMFPTTHDITPKNLEHCMAFLSKFLNPGNKVLIVSKPHLECVRAICDSFQQYKQNILFRFTIGSADNQILKFWDQYAPDFDERLASLVYAYEAGYQTSVSIEPMLDDKPDVLINKLMPYVTDAIWLGKLNDMRVRLRMNGHGDEKTMQRARELMNSHSDEYILALYSQYKSNPQIKWKESIKKIIGLEVPTECGLDI